MPLTPTLSAEVDISDFGRLIATELG